MRAGHGLEGKRRRHAIPFTAASGLPCRHSHHAHLHHRRALQAEHGAGDGAKLDDLSLIRGHIQGHDRLESGAGDSMGRSGQATAPSPLTRDPGRTLARPSHWPRGS